MLLTDLAAKELEILKKAAPGARRIGVLWNPTTPSHPPALKAVETGGEKLGVQLLMVPTATVEDFDGAFSTLTRERVDAFFVLASPITVSPLRDLERGIALRASVRSTSVRQLVACRPR
jgi:putative ABC transport system substrate-binding protein